MQSEFIQGKSITPKVSSPADNRKMNKANSLELAELLNSQEVINERVSELQMLGTGSVRDNRHEKDKSEVTVMREPHDAHLESLFKPDKRASLNLDL